MPNNEDLNAFLAKDKQQNPSCSYSTQQSTSCRCVNGDTKCETVQRIFRRCPGEQPKEVFNVREEQEGDGVQMGGSMNSSSFQFGGGGGGDDLQEHFGGGAGMPFMMNPFAMLEGMLGGGFGHPHRGMPTDPRAHPHRPDGGMGSMESEAAPAPHLSPRGQYRDPRTISPQHRSTQ